jgi:hypothetical protein
MEQSVESRDYGLAPLTLTPSSLLEQQLKKNLLLLLPKLSQHGFFLPLPLLPPAIPPNSSY